MKIFLKSIAALVFAFSGAFSIAHAQAYYVGSTEFTSLSAAKQEVDDLGNMFGVVESVKAPAKSPVRLGAVNYPTGGGTYRLASSISSTQTTVKLSSFLEPTSNAPYTMTYLNSALEYATLDPQTSNSEFISFTGITQNSDGTATLTGVTRGLGRSYPYTSQSVFRTTHSGQSILILSNPPQLYNDIYSYINNATYAGSVPASPSILGLVQIGTAAQAAANQQPTVVGATTTYYAVATSIASSTRRAGTPQVVVSSSTDGYIDSSFINLAGSIPGYSATSATSTFATSSINIGAFNAYQIGKNVRVISSTGTSTFAVPSGITKVYVRMAGGGGGGSGVNGDAGGGGGASGYGERFVDVTGTTSIQVFVGSGGPGGSSGANSGSSGTWSTFGTNGFYISCNPGTGGVHSSFTGAGIGGTCSGGDVNVQGGDGGNGMTLSTTLGIGAQGGASFFGGGAHAPNVNTGTQAGSNSNAYGSGGPSGASVTSGGTSAGGNGAQGIVIISW